MALALAEAIVSLRGEKHRPSNYDRRKMVKAARSLEGLAGPTHVGLVDDWTAAALGTLATSKTLPHVKADGVEYIEPNYRTAKQKKRDKKQAKQLAKRAASSGDKAIKKPEDLPKVTKPKVEKAPVSTKAVKTKPMPAAKTPVKHTAKAVSTDMFIDIFTSTGIEEAYAYLRDCFGVDDSRNNSRVSAHCEALMMEYISAHAHTFLAVSLVIEEAPYGRVNPHFAMYKSRRTESMWQHHNGPLVTRWKGEPYLISESHGYWEAMGTDDEHYVEAKRRRGHRLPIGYLQWLEEHAVMNKTVCELGGEDHNRSLQTFSRRSPIMVGDLRVGTELSTTSVLVPHTTLAVQEEYQGREVRSGISRIVVAGRLAEGGRDNVVAVDFVNKEKVVASVEVQKETNDLPPTVSTQQPDDSVVAPAHLQAVKASRHTVDRNHQRMLAFRDTALQRLMPRYVVHNTEAAPVTTQTVTTVQPVHDFGVKGSALYTLGRFDCKAPAANDKVVGHNDDLRSLSSATEETYQTWCNGRESRAAWEKDKATQARYMDRRLGEAWLKSAKRVGLPLYDDRLTKAERLNRLGSTRLLNAPTYTPREMQLIHQNDDYSYESNKWSMPQTHCADLRLWLLRAEWADSVHHEFTTTDMAYACVRTSVAGTRHVSETFSCTEDARIVLPAAGLELSGQGKALVVDLAGHEVVADKPLIVTKPDDTIVTVKEESLFSQIMASVPGAMTELQSALVKAIDTGVPVSEVRRLVSQYSEFHTESDGGILVA